MNQKRCFEPYGSKWAWNASNIFFYLWSCGMHQFFPCCEFVFLFVFEQLYWAFCLLDVHTFGLVCLMGKYGVIWHINFNAPAINATDFYFILRIGVLFFIELRLKTGHPIKLAVLVTYPELLLLQLGATNKQTIFLSDSERRKNTKLACLPNYVQLNVLFAWISTSLAEISSNPELHLPIKVIAERSHICDDTASLYSDFFKHWQHLNIKFTHFNKHIIFTIPQKSQYDSHCVTAACCERWCACCEGIDLVVREMISKIKPEQRSYR